VRDPAVCERALCHRARPPDASLIVLIDVAKDRFEVEVEVEVELVCLIMRVAGVGFLTSRSFRAAKSRPLSARTLSDQLIGGEIARLHAENYGIYGVRKMHRLLDRQGWAIGRLQTGGTAEGLDDSLTCGDEGRCWKEGHHAKSDSEGVAGRCRGDRAEERVDVRPDRPGFRDLRVVCAAVSNDC